MIYVLVPQHVLTLMSLDSAAEGRERAWGEADGLQMLVLKCVDACTSLGHAVLHGNHKGVLW